MGLKIFLLKIDNGVQKKGNNKVYYIFIYIVSIKKYWKIFSKEMRFHISIL